MKLYTVLVMFGLVCYVYGVLPQEPQKLCQGKCNSTATCELLFPHCGCPSNHKECNKSSLVTDNGTSIVGGDQCCYCDNVGTHCTVGVESTKDRGVNDTARLIIVFFDDCEYLELNETTKGRFLGLFAEAFYNWTNINTTERLVIENNISCTTGEVPNCGVDVAALTSPTTNARRRRSVQENTMDEEKAKIPQQKETTKEKRIGERYLKGDKVEGTEEDGNLVEVKSRVRRKIGGGRMRSSSKTKKGSGSDLDLDYTTGYGFIEEIITCGGLALNMKLLPGNGSDYTASETINLLTDMMLNESLTLRFSAEYDMVAEMMFYGINNNTLVMKRVPYPEKYNGPRFVPPMEMDFRPFLYAAGSLVGLFLLIVSYKMLKHTIFLKYDKFTRINSDAIQTKKVLLPPLERKEIDKEEKATPLPATQRPNFNMSFTRVPVVDNDRLARKFDWTTPIYLPGMLDPVRDNEGTTENQRLTLEEDKDINWE